MLLRGVILFGLLLTTPALAIDFSAPFTSDGKPICAIEMKGDADCPADKIFTLRIAARNALYMSFPDERDISGDEKFRRAALAQELTGAGDVKLKAEDVALIKKLIAKMYGPLVVYQAWRELDPH